MLAILLALMFAQAPASTVRLTWIPYPLARPTNAGWYNIWRAPKVGDFCTTPTDFAWIGHVQQTFAPDGTPIAPAFVDAAPLHGTGCYAVSFIQTPSGTPDSVETERSTPVEAIVP